MDKSADAFRTISEVAAELDLPQHVLRFWETRFPQIKPLKRAGGRRFYRPSDIELLRAIRRSLYGEGYTIKGVQRILKEQGARGLVAAAPASQTADFAEAAADLRSPRGQPDFINDLFAPLDLADESAADESVAAEDGLAAPRAETIRQLKAVLAEIEACERMLDIAARP